MHMSKTAFIRARIEPNLKHNAEQVLHALGMTPTQAVTLLYTEVARHQHWPFPLKVPNAQTRKTFEETDRGIGLVECKDANDLCEKLGI